MIPQNALAGEVVVIGVKLIEPVNLLLSVPPAQHFHHHMKKHRRKKVPHVVSPFTTDCCVVGSKETPISFAVMTPFANKLSVTVGIVDVVAGDRVPIRR